jgi:hypothetical protein
MSIEEQVHEVAKLKLGALRQRFQEVTGQETRSNNRPYLIRQIAKALAARGTVAPTAPAAPGDGPSPPAARAQDASDRPRARPRARGGRGKERDPRLPPVGRVLEREYDGKVIRAKILDDGFEHRGKRYRSLSTLVKDATGTVWNGYLFFGLAPYPRRKKAE